MISQQIWPIKHGAICSRIWDTHLALSDILDKVLLEHIFIDDILGSTSSVCTLHFSKTVVLLFMHLSGLDK